METNTIKLASTKQPHQDISVLLRGNTQNPARALLLFHGRFAQAENILGLLDSVSLPEDMIVCAPQAVDRQWYPKRFIVPREHNEPHLSSALGVVDELLRFCSDKYDISAASVTLAGFSQGACLVADYVARNPRKYAGACVYSGGIIGADEDIASHEWSGDLKSTPVYVGCDEQDPHIPSERVTQTCRALSAQNARVTCRLYSGIGHAIHPEGISMLHDILSRRAA